jgi:hypothetical protein
MHIFSDIQDYYFKVEKPKVNKHVSEFKAEIGARGRCWRLDYLYDCLIELDLELAERQKAYQKSIEDDRVYIERALIASYIPQIEKGIAKLEREINFIVKGVQLTTDDVTPEMIEQARQYPIESLIEAKRHMAICSFHDDHQPSMGIKNNRFHCFACGAKGDVIEFVMKRDGLSFKDAVKFLI